MMKDWTLKSNNKEGPKTAKVGGISTEDKMTKLVQEPKKQMDSLQTKKQQMSTSVPRTRQRPICDKMQEGLYHTLYSLHELWARRTYIKRLPRETTTLGKQTTAAPKGLVVADGTEDTSCRCNN